MAGVLLDTNICIRLADIESPANGVSEAALSLLMKAGHDPLITPQVLVEFWAVVTRPKDANGFGWSGVRAKADIEWMQFRFGSLPDHQAIIEKWLEIVASADIKGKRTHDARLAAAMEVYDVTHILTFNGSDFASFPKVTVLDPVKVAAGEVMPSH